MSIEKDIKQITKFRNEWQKAAVNILYTYNWLLEQQKRHFDRGGLTHQQYNILRILKGSGQPISTLQIRERMLDKMSDTSRIVDRLVTKALVKKITCPTDKRMVDVTITAKGKKLLEKLDAFELKMDEVAGTLTEDDAKTMNKLLDKMRMSL